MNRACRLTVIVKALNEEARIGAALESALAAVQAAGGGEVVLADSCSTDATARVACGYPVRVVQLLDPRERCCGIGPQLGLQHARGEFIYLMDGDMCLLPGFLEQALAFLAQHPEVAGVGGRVVERNQDSLEYREREQRMRTREAHRRPGAVDRLDGGALYRRLAIQEAGYLSDRNLHSYEELDLAVRLRARGWKLWRLPVDAVSHEGHRAPALRLLWQRWRSGYACGCGEVLRAALGQPWQRLVLRELRELRLYAAVWVWWLALAAGGWLALRTAGAGGPAWAGPAALATLAALALAPGVGVALRKRSLARGGYALAAWCVNAAGLARGLLRRRRSPRAPIASRVLREPQEPCTPAPAPARPRPPWLHRS